MKQRFKNLASRLLLAVSLTATLALTGCSKADDATDNELPLDSRYPMTFTVAVERQTGTRATATDDTWTKGDNVALQVDEVVKQYTVEDNGSGALSSQTPHYWPTTTTPMSVQAWYPYSNSRPTTFTVQANQSGTGFQQSDLLYTSQSITYNASTPPKLIFKHLPVKVVVNLKNGDGITEGEVKMATVTLINQALESGTISYDDGTTNSVTVAVVTTGTQNIIPHSMEASGGCQQTVQTLIVPQQMKDRQFIRVEIGDKTFYYTPTVAEYANLAAGNQYTYNITVKKTELVVTASSSVLWDEETENSTPTEATFLVTMPEGHGQSVRTSSNAVLDGSNYNVKGSSFTLSYTMSAGDMPKSFPVVKGLCDFKNAFITAGRTTTCTFTYSNIRSDLWLSYDFYAEVGNYYYNDGTWSSVKDNNKTCIGVVFYVGQHSLDGTDYSSSGIGQSKCNGYVVALQDASSSSWGPAEFVEVSTSEIDWNGYSNQKILNDKGISNYPAAQACANYTPSAPDKSSGWFLPSAGQLKVGLYDNRTALGEILVTAGGSQFNLDDYWSSTGGNGENSKAWFVGFNGGYVLPDDKFYSLCVRAVLAF